MQALATPKTIARGIAVLFLLAALGGYARAQSTDIAWPSAVRSNEIRGTIRARDLGDPRVTDHYYAFIANPGDILITVDSSNLNGDIDVFTSSNLRPLLKFTVYAGSSSPITKSLYLRRQESLILRVEGRTPDDDEAVYRLHFGGAFEPITSGPLVEHEDALEATTAAATSNRGERRVSSVGARIDEPPTEVAAVPTAQPSPITSSEPETKAPTKPAPRNTRTRGTVARRTRPARTPKAKPANAPAPDETVAKAEPGEKPTGESSETESSSAPARPARRTRGSRAPKPSPPQEIDESGPRLVIETSDGTLVDRSMGGVRRVTVENGQVVVIGKDGKIQRIPLANVVRMTIAP